MDVIMTILRRMSAGNLLQFVGFISGMAIHGDNICAPDQYGGNWADD